MAAGSVLTLIAATRNSAKVRELQRLVGSRAVIAPLPHDISPKILEIETAGRVEENAIAKAVSVSRSLPEGQFAIASDGGLLVPALGAAWDPTRTRRFAGEAASDLERADRLLALAADLRGDDRRIGWRESVAAARSGELLASWSAESAPGLLAERVDPAAIAAGGGFWILALWRCPEFGGKLLSELTGEERARREDHWNTLVGPVRDWIESESISVERGRDNGC